MRWMVIGKPFLSRAAEGMPDGPIWESGGLVARSQRPLLVVVINTISDDCQNMWLAARLQGHVNQLFWCVRTKYLARIDNPDFRT